MKNKLMLFGLISLVAVLCMSLASAVVPNRAPYANGLAYGYASYGSYPVNPSMGGVHYPYASQPVRIGGFFGGNSAFLIGLKPGFYDGPRFDYRTRNYISSQYYPRIGGNFGYGYTGGYYNLRPGTFTFGGGYTGGAPSYYYHGAV